MNEHWFEKIDDYLNGSMTDTERVQFEAEMASNAELLSLFQTYREIEKEMSDLAGYSIQEAALKRSLEDLGNRYFKVDLQQETDDTAGYHNTKEPTRVIPIGDEFRQVKKIQLWKSLAVAASIIGLIVIGTIWYQQSSRDQLEARTGHKSADTSINLSRSDSSSKIAGIEKEQNRSGLEAGKEDTEQLPIQDTSKKDTKDVLPERPAAEKLEALYAIHFKPDTLPVLKAGPLQGAFHHYEIGEYEDAIAAFDEVDPDLVTRGNEAGKELSNFYVYYYKGLSYLATNQATIAIPILEQAMTRSPDAFNKGKSLWYLSLAYLKAGRSEKAMASLKALARNQQAGIYRDQSIKLMDELKMNRLQ